MKISMVRLLNLKIGKIQRKLKERNLGLPDFISARLIGSTWKNVSMESPANGSLHRDADVIKYVGGFYWSQAY